MSEGCKYDVYKTIRKKLYASTFSTNVLRCKKYFYIVEYNFVMSIVLLFVYLNAFSV